MEQVTIQLQENISQSFENFSSSLSDMQESTVTLQSETETQFEQLSNEIEDTHQLNLVTLLDEFSTEVSQSQMSEITEGFSHLESGLTEIYSTYSTETEEIINLFTDQGSEILSNVGTYCQESLCQELEDTFENATEEAVQAIAEEVTQNLFMMVAGGSASATLAPLLPLLVAAKAAMRFIKFATGGLLG